MNTFDYLTDLTYCGASPRLPHFDEYGANYGFEGKDVQVNEADLIRPKQVHGAELVDGARVQGSLQLEGDAIYTNSSQLIGIATADCLPILIASKSGSLVMVIHAGWRGLAQGVVLRSVVAAKREVAGAELLVGLGPCISQAHYEVGPEVIAALQSGPLDFNEAELMAALSRGRDDRWHLDLAVVACITLAKHDVPAANVGIVRSCTFDHPSMWHSYRRDGKKAGRNTSWIKRI